MDNGKDKLTMLLILTGWRPPNSFKSFKSFLSIIYHCYDNSLSTIPNLFTVLTIQVQFELDQLENIEFEMISLRSMTSSHGLENSVGFKATQNSL